MLSQKFGVQMPGRHHVPLAERGKSGQVVRKVEWEDEEIVSRHTVFQMMPRKAAEMQLWSPGGGGEWRSSYKSHLKR